MSQELMISDNGVIARAELDVQISTAKAYPRSVAQCIENAETLATLDEETAQSCFYVLARKDKDGARKEIVGPSIRLAEIMASSWKNIHAATRIVENDGKHITAEGVCWDLENNVKMSAQSKVSIVFGKGNSQYTANVDMQTVLSNAVMSKALRNSIFKVIPKALVSRVMQKAMSFAVGDQKSVNSKVAEVIDKLIKMGIDRQKILDYYGHTNLSQFTGEDYRSLIGVGTAIKEKHITIEECFDVEKDGDSNLSAAEKISNLIHSKKMESSNG